MPRAAIYAGIFTWPGFICVYTGAAAGGSIFLPLREIDNAGQHDLFTAIHAGIKTRLHRYSAAIGTKGLKFLPNTHLANLGILQEVFPHTRMLSALTGWQQAVHRHILQRAGRSLRAAGIPA